MTDSSKKGVWVWVGVIVLVIIVILFFVWPRQKPGTTTTTTTGSNAVFAPSGELTSGLPPQLVLDSESVSSSYSINYSSTSNLYTARWNSTSSMQKVYVDYIQYLPAHGWTITNEITNNVASRGIYATNGSSSVNIGITFGAVNKQLVTSVTLGYGQQ